MAAPKWASTGLGWEEQAETKTTKNEDGETEGKEEKGDAEEKGDEGKAGPSAASMVAGGASAGAEAALQARAALYESRAQTATPSCLVRLVRHDVMQMALEEGSAVIYHIGGNTCRYKEAEEGKEVMPLSAAPAIDKLVTSYPSWTAIEDLPEAEADEEEAEEDEEDEQQNGGKAAKASSSFDRLAFAQHLLGCGVLEMRE